MELHAAYGILLVLSNTTQHVILSNCANLYNTYVTAVAVEAIGWHYYLVFVGLNLVYAVVWFLFGVETRGRTLEELDAVFEAKFPPRAALRKTVMVKKGDGHLEGLPADNNTVGRQQQQQHHAAEEHA